MSLHKPQSPAARNLNRRRYHRQAVIQQARLKVPGLADLSCEIRDFCQGGVFLKLDEGVRGLETLRARGDEAVEIDFTPNGSKAAFRLRGRIAHIAVNGLGVAFSDPPPAAALRALQERSKASPARAQPADDKAFDREPIKKTCRQALEELLPGILGDFFGQIDPALLNAAENAGTNAEQAMYFETIAQLKTHRPRIESSFYSRALEQAESFSGPDSDFHPQTFVTSGLSLVDNAEFEDWLNLNSEIVKVESLHHDELQLIEQRLAALAHRDINRKNNPYGPGRLSHAFHSALNELRLPNPAKRVLYSAFSEALEPRLCGLYPRLDEITLPLADSLPPAKAPKRATAAESSSTPESAPGSLPELAQPQPALQAPPMAPARMPDVLQTAGALLALCAQSEAVNEQIPSPASPAAPSAIIAALQQLQAEKMARNIEYIEARALESQLALALSAQGESAGSLTGGHKQTFEILEAILDKALAETTLASGVKSYVQKLQIPLLQAAVADPTLLHAETHPARAVFNLIDLFAIAGNERGEIENKQLGQSLSTITDRIIREAGENPAVFEEARVQLEKLAEPLLKARAVRIDRVQEACQGGQRIKNARRVAERAIQERIGGKTVATIIPALLDCGWRQLLVLTALRHGPESDQWDRQMGVVDKLLGWLAGENPEKPPTPSEAGLLIQFVEEELLAVCPNQAVLGRVTDELTALLLGVGSPRERRSPQFVSLPETEKEREIRSVESTQLKPFRVGDWLKFTLKPGTETPMRLTWIGEDPAHYVFVNRKGGKELELGPAEFARYLNDKLAVRTESLDLPLMERTANTLMQTMQDRLKYQASHDPVTGLINRKEFIRRLERHFGPDQPQETPHLLCLMEIDQLRIINNLCGVEAGDRLLKELGELIGDWLNEDDILARLGDNNFGVLLPRCGRDAGRVRLESLLDTICQYHFTSGPHSFSLGVNMGLVAGAPGRGDVVTLLKNADAACLASKQKGRNLIQVYSEDDAALEAQNNLMDWAGRIDKLLAENRLFVRCQLIRPIFPERGMEPHHEILLGIRDEQNNVVSPAVFVPAAERWKRMSEVDRWQIQSVFRWISQNNERFRQIGGFSINLSGLSLNSDDFLAFLQELLTEVDFPAEKITFEITETAAVDDFSRAEKFIRQIKRYGCKFSLDDFGSGFSSYAYLKNLQVDYLKIDGSFVKDLATSPTDYALVKSMNEIGHSLGMRTIAEYVENEKILEKLKEIGVDYAQGYGIRKPVSIDEVS